jgi:hypothetical protein
MGLGVFDSLGSIVKTISGFAKQAKPILEIAKPLISGVATVGSHFLSQRESEKQAERERQAAEHAFELEERRRKAASEEARAERERLLAAASQSGPSTSQSRQVASDAAANLERKYPAAFKALPRLRKQTEDQILGALLNPADPTDPSYFNKALGEIEHNISLTNYRLDPSGATSPPEEPEAPKKKAAKAKGGRLGLAHSLGSRSGARQRGSGSLFGGGIGTPVRDLL